MKRLKPSLDLKKKKNKKEKEKEKEEAKDTVRLNLFNYVFALFRVKFACNSANVRVVCVRM